jgi:hypothetical protein
MHRTLKIFKSSPQYAGSTPEYKACYHIIWNVNKATQRWFKSSSNGVRSKKVPFVCAGKRCSGEKPKIVKLNLHEIASQQFLSTFQIWTIHPEASAPPSRGELLRASIVQTGLLKHQFHFITVLPAATLRCCLYAITTSTYE